jgi:hypothetical protein
MALADVLNEYTSKLSDGCSFKKLFDSLSDADQKSLEIAIEKKVPTAILIRALKAEGYKTSNDSFYNHKRGSCKCPKIK